MNEENGWKVWTLLAGEFGPMPEWMRIRQSGVDPGANIPSYIYLLRKDGANVLVDTSFSSQLDVEEKMGIYCKRENSIDALLSGYGISCADITIVILTHLHWDHAGGFDIFPNARIYCQKEEFDWMCRTREWDIGYPEWHAEKLWKKANIFQFIDGNTEILPGLKVWKYGGHTPGSQMAGVETAHGLVIIPGDNVMCFENVERNIPVGLMCDLRQCMAAIEKIRLEAVQYLPSHDWKTIGK